MWVMIESALDLGSAFIDFLMVSSVSLPALHLIGIILVAFLLGLFLGRITKRRVYKVIEHVGEPGSDRISLDFNRLTPLGPSKEEAVENSAMDISDLRVDRTHQQPGEPDLDRPEEPTLLKE